MGAAGWVLGDGGVTMGAGAAGEAGMATGAAASFAGAVSRVSHARGADAVALCNPASRHQSA